MTICSTKKIASRATLTALLAAGVVGMMSTSALAQGFGGHPTMEPSVGHASGSKGKGSAASKKKLGPEYIVVDQSGRQGYTSIQKAIDDVRYGGVVMVLPGDYKENIVLSKPVSLQGDRGPGMRVRILPQDSTKPCLSYEPTNETSHALVSNITFDTRDMSTGRVFTPAQSELAPGSLGNDDSFNKTANMAKADAGSNVACISITGGVFTMKDSTVDGNRHHTGPLVQISSGSVTLQKNTITDGQGIGVLVSQKHSLWDRAFLVDNNITNNLDSGIELMSDSTMLATGNLVHRNYTGIKYNGQGDATIIGNKVLNNRGNGIMLDRRAKQVIMRLNQIWENKQNGIKIYASGGLIESNDIRAPVGFFEIDQRDAGLLNLKIENDVGVNRGTKTAKKKKSWRSKKIKDNLNDRNGFDSDDGRR